MAVSVRAVPHSSGDHKSVTEPQLNKAGKSSASSNKGNAPMPLPMPWMMPWMPWMPMFGAQPCGMMPAMPMPMPMPMAPPMPGGRKAAAAASAKPSAAPGSCSARGTATPAVPAAVIKVPESAAAATTAAADEAGDDDVPLKPDEEVTVEPDELEVFEKVAAMEREKQEKQQQQASQQFERASSPSGSCFTTMTGGSGSAPCSPVSAMQHPMPFPPGMPCFPFAPGFPCMPMGPMAGFPQPAHALPQQQQQPQSAGMIQQQQQPQHSQHHWQKQAQQLWKPQPVSQVANAGNSQAEVVPVPWRAFAADDSGDDLDKDLQELIMLPPADCMQQPEPCAAADAAAAAVPAAAGPAAAAKARSSSLRRIGSTASTHSTASVLNPTALGQANYSDGSKTKRVLRIRNAKGSSGAAGGGHGSGSGGSTTTGGSRIVLKGSTARRNGTQQQQQAVSAALGPIKAGVQKKITPSSSKGGSSGSHNKLSPSTVTGSPAMGGSVLAAAAVLGSKPQQEQQQGVLTAAAMQVDEEPSLSLLGDLDSCLSGGDALTAGVMPAEDYWDGFMQEASDDGWDSLLGNNDLDFIVPAGL